MPVYVIPATCAADVNSHGANRLHQGQRVVNAAQPLQG